MNQLIKIWIATVCLIFFSGNGYAQKSGNNYFTQIKNQNLANIFLVKNIKVENDKNVFESQARPELLGFIGNDHQRFYIHFTSMLKNPQNPYQYTVQGKTKVRETVRPFKGTITVRSANIRKAQDMYPGYQSGYATCDVTLYEDHQLSATGSITGQLTITYMISPKKQFLYNTLNYQSDNFSNNQFRGQWTSYKTKTSKICNFGDFRIPDSGDLDIGAGEFSPDPKYFHKGWKYYILSRYGETEIDSDLGKKEERREWWK